MKKILAFTLSVLLLLTALTACADKPIITEPVVTPTETTSVSTTATTTQEEKLKHTRATDPDGIATVTGDEAVNVRSGPGTEYEKVSTVRYGEKYTVIGEGKNSKNVTWYKLDLGGGKSGWISGNMVSLPVHTVTLAQSSDYPDVGRNMAVVTGSEVVNVRTGAGSGYEKVTEVKQGETYPVVGFKEAANHIIWYKIDLDGGRSGYVSSNMVTAPRLDASLSGKRAYLTFDDGPSKFTRTILDILDEYGVKATWFVIYHKDSEQLYKEIVNRGQAIALHTYSHDYKRIYKSEEGFFSDLEKIDNYIYKVTGVRTKLFRFPGGSSNTVSKKYCKGIMKRLTKSVEARGYVYFDWNISSGDADKTPHTAEQIYKTIVNGCKNKTTVNILMHDTRSKHSTVAALPYIIEYLQSQNFDILPLTEDSFDAHQDVRN